MFPHKVLVEESCLGEPLARRILDRLGDRPVEVVKDPLRAAEIVSASPDPVSEGKKLLLLARQKGRFVKPCPCSPGVIGCGYVVIDQVRGCPLDCSYCLLQDYLAAAPVTVFCNLDRLWTELEGFVRRAGVRRRLRVGTGEFGDSLALDPLTGLSAAYIDFFRRRPGAVFELKTKTVAVEELLGLDPPGNVVVSWSLNAPAVAEAEEHGAPPVGERIRAAARLQKRGYGLGFHFDPLVDFPGWEEAYEGVVDDLFRAVPAGSVRWISLGALRFPPGVIRRLEERFPGSRLTAAELVQGPDGKDRYFRPRRARLLRTVARQVRRRGGEGIPLYLCMETAAVWRAALKKKREETLPWNE
ncbi:MAG: hypothetical protein FJY83_05920, partial [Candidatus Aminicenantes bacterium]|nr:hypothetical protein [Candidatus Aminicenantes bacterium]